MVPAKEPPLTLNQEIIERIQNAQTSIHHGLLAYQAKDYAQAVELLSEGLDVGYDYWRCHFYLAMAYYQTGLIEKSGKQFLHILNWCPNPDLQSKATQALAAMKSELQSLQGEE
jgi:tetratricopeptide (TPR) repeat protein